MNPETIASKIYTGKLTKGSYEVLTLTSEELEEAIIYLVDVHYPTDESVFDSELFKEHLSILLNLVEVKG